MNTGQHFGKRIQQQFFNDKNSLFIDAAAINFVDPIHFSEVTGEKSIIGSKYLLTKPHFLTLDKGESLKEAKYSNQKPIRKFDFIFEDIHTRLVDYYCSSDSQDLSEKVARHSPNIETYNMLSDKGVALIVNHEVAFIDSDLTDKLNKNGFYVNGVLGLPLSNKPLKGFNDSIGVRNDSLFIISRTKSENTFIADLSHGSIREKDYWLQIFDNYLMQRDSGSIKYGQLVLYLPCPIYRYIASMIELEKITSTKSNNENYSSVYGLRDLVESIHWAPDIVDYLEVDHHGIFFKSHCELDSLRRPPATTSLDMILTIDVPLDYIYIQFKGDVESEKIKYIELYLCTEAGKHVRFFWLFQPFFLENDFSYILIMLQEIILDKLLIILPNKEGVVKDLVNANEKIGKLQKSIAKFQEGMNSNPELFVSENINRIDDALDKMNLLNDADKIRAMIRGVESSIVEFKESWRYPKKLIEGQDFNKISVNIEVTLFKVINSFFNSYGGNLVIGIDDDNLSIVGINEELEYFFPEYKELSKKIERFKGKLKEKLDFAFDKSFVDLIDYKAIGIDDKFVFLITCPAAKKPCFFKQKFVDIYTNKLNKTVCSFYVREKDNTVCRKDKEQHEYITNRWSPKPQSN